MVKKEYDDDIYGNIIFNINYMQITICEHRGHYKMLDGHVFDDSEQILHTELSDIEMQAIRLATAEQVKIILHNYLN